ncbi:39S ribosomal protein L18, mitochondrial isoform X1 [Neomonachus schauinslandi]|uniref:Large ribosomal subunit protein uL18m n=1 Tax=Neomonachus schauinslandi TaxID=29088 RepID=A0A2Y9HBW1_NEOSC|nr:39S ribosomal protein L18, mitochondrial isoform X1 [Neomonachus schauinslandi]
MDARLFRGFPRDPSAMALRSRLWEKLSVCRNPGCGVAALSTSSKPAAKPEVDPLENAAVAPEFTNRNPRNLELLGVARKERGWGTTWPSREFWHRLRVIRTQHHVEALVEHRNGQVVVSASTREWAIKKHLYSTKNVVACESIGRVLAERCLEAGINFMVYQPTPWEAASDSMKRLQSAMTEGGVVLQEPRRIYE